MRKRLPLVAAIFDFPRWCVLIFRRTVLILVVGFIAAGAMENVGKTSSWSPMTRYI